MSIGVLIKKNWLLRGFAFNYKIDLEKFALDQIHSIEFVNSLCFIKKKPSVENKLGNRTIAGEKAQIYPDVLKLNGKPSPDLNESKNPWSNKDLFPEEEIDLCKKKIEQQEQQILSLKKEIESLKKK